MEVTRREEENQVRSEGVIGSWGQMAEGGLMGGDWRCGQCSIQGRGEKHGWLLGGGRGFLSHPVCHSAPPKSQEGSRYLISAIQQCRAFQGQTDVGLCLLEHSPSPAN